ncbi:MAG: HAMP domain-containing sensor histidine kinase [Planctomycetota bacterium]|nr:HAMP domain-containing sensor histidine kinase [Planctomycetota bacterium]
MKRTSTVWLIYVLALATTTAAMGWVTHHTLQLEREEKLAALRAENERLALWRMESVLLPFVSSESSRDYSEWGSLDWGNSGRIDETGEFSSSGNLFFTVRFGSPYVARYFRCDSTGRFATGRSVVADPVAAEMPPPEMPPPEMEPELSSLGSDTSRETLFATTRKARDAFPLSTTVRNPWTTFPVSSDDDGTQQDGANPSEQSTDQLDSGPQEVQSLALGPKQQQERSNLEFQRRMNNTIQNGSNFVSQVALANGFSNSANASPIRRDGAGPMTAFWLDDELLLARHVSRGNWEAVEGGILKYEAIRKALLTEVRGMFPDAKLVSASSGLTGNPLALASLPLQLIPGPMPVDESRGWTPMSTSLAIAWCCLALSALAIGVLLLGVVQLSERRAAFVSAVTHELRSPLTTFRLYSDLLADRANLTDEKHDTYATTLQSESERLSHLVENVLSWSRLDKTSGPELTEVVSWDDQLSRSLPALERRAAQAGMTLTVAENGKWNGDAGAPLRFHANTTAVDQILFNLVDNSCKYASQSETARVEISAEVSGSAVAIRVRDLGPGLSTDALATLFQPFSKSASAAAKTAPGVGLGLSLCRRLARSMSGELTHIANASGGTTIELRLPVVTKSVEASKYDP